MTRLLIAASMALTIMVSGCTQKPAEETAKKPEAAKVEDVSAARPMVEPGGISMEKQHDTMRIFSAEWEKARKAAKAGKTKEEAESLAKMREASGELNKFMLHKNAKNREEFLKKANEFRSLVMDVEKSSGSGKSLKEVAPEIDKACNGCHQAFR